MKELLENHPLTAKLIREYYTKNWIEHIEKASHLPEDFLEFAKTFELDNEKIALILQDQPRGLFDFFDNQSVRVWTKYTEKGWQIHIDKVKHGGNFTERRDAESYGVEQAFKILEEKLNKDVGVSQSDTSDSGE
jgi:hypothetical protein